MTVKKGMGFTLYELLVVVIIIGLIAAIALPNFTGFQERSYGKEAKANLKLVIGAERNYRLENGTSFYNSGSVVTDIDRINQNLSLSLNTANWNYSVNATDTAVTATAARTKSSGAYSGCVYTLTYDASSASNPDDPTAGANCPN